MLTAECFTTIATVERKGEPVRYKGHSSVLVGAATIFETWTEACPTKEEAAKQLVEALMTHLGLTREAAERVVNRHVEGWSTTVLELHFGMRW